MIHSSSARRPCLFVASLVLSCSAATTQAPKQGIDDLSEAEKAALATITLGKITTTVSFLASDELAGRMTPSKELRIAGAYVAARFRGAGLEGLGEGGSFYLQGKDKRVPADARVIVRDSLDGAPPPIEGVALLAAAEARIEMTYTTSEAGAGMNATAYGTKDEGVFLVDAAPLPDAPGAAGLAKGDLAVFGLLRQARFAKRAEGKILLVRTPMDSPLRTELSARSLEALAGAGIAILLVPAGFTSGRYFFDVPAWSLVPSENRNVCGLLRGSDEALAAEAILVTAHLDHIGVAPPRRDGKDDSGADSINNGADDDATGCTAVLALADAFAALPQRPKRSLLFMTFYGEEGGLRGSRFFAAHPAWPLEKIVANINIEMIGRPEEGARQKMWMTGWTKSNLGEIVHEGSQRVGVTCFRHQRFSPMLYRQSDNWSFVEKGVIAHSFSAGSLHGDYHKPSDEWQKLDLEHMVDVTRGLFAGMLPLAHGARRPEAK